MSGLGLTGMASLTGRLPKNCALTDIIVCGSSNDRLADDNDDVINAFVRCMRNARGPKNANRRVHFMPALLSQTLLEDEDVRNLFEAITQQAEQTAGLLLIDAPTATVFVDNLHFDLDTLKLVFKLLVAHIARLN